MLLFYRCDECGICTLHYAAGLVDEREDANRRIFRSFECFDYLLVVCVHDFIQVFREVLFFEEFLLAFVDVADVELLEFLICEVYAELLETVFCEHFESEDV